MAWIYSITRMSCSMQWSSSTIVRLANICSVFNEYTNHFLKSYNKNWEQVHLTKVINMNIL